MRASFQQQWRGIGSRHRYGAIERRHSALRFGVNLRACIDQHTRDTRITARKARPVQRSAPPTVPRLKLGPGSNQALDGIGRAEYGGQMQWRSIVREFLIYVRPARQSVGDLIWLAFDQRLDQVHVRPASHALPQPWLQDSCLAPPIVSVTQFSCATRPIPVKENQGG